MSKLGFHVNGITDNKGMLALFTHAQPAVIKSLHPDKSFWAAVKLACPKTLLVGRYFVENQPLSDPVREAIRFGDLIKRSTCAHLYDVWEGYNETPRNKRKSRYDFDIKLAAELHREDMKYCCGSWSVGVPDIHDWDDEGMKASLEASDMVACHEYCAPTMNDPRGLIQGAQMGWFTLRYRMWYPRLPLECQKPLIISECGIDSGAAHWSVSSQGGWRSFTTLEGYLEQLKWYDGFLLGDPYVVGATIFCYGTFDPTWSTYDVSGHMAQLIADYIQDQASPVPPSDDIRELERRVAAIEAKLLTVADILGFRS